MRKLLIGLALVVLLSLSLNMYFALQLGYIHQPFLTTAGTPPPTPPVFIEVPDLRGMTYQDAQTTAMSIGVRIRSVNGTTTGIVIAQSPPAHDMASRGAFIEVLMQTLLTVPLIPKDTPLALASTIQP